MRKIIGYTITLSPIWGFLLWIGVAYGAWKALMLVAGVMVIIAVMVIGTWIVEGGDD